MKKLRLFLAFLLVSVICTSVNAKSITGTVVQATDNEPVIGATVQVKGTARGTITDFDGKFTIEVNDNELLVVSFLGYLPQELKPINNMIIKLQEDSKTLDDVVVTAMGISRDKKALGYAVQDVKADELTQAASSNLSSALQGKISGLEISASSGMPGASSKVTIRGARSFTGNNAPLYVIDGMPIASGSDMSTNQSVTGSDYANRALDINPSDIESINVLKGQAASALYGLRASNGVIVITTKSGKGAKKGKATVTINSNLSFETLSITPDLQSEYAQGSGGVYKPTASTSWGPKISELANDPTYGGNTDNTYTQADGMQSGKYYVPQRAAAGLNPWAVPQSYDNVGDFFKTGISFTNSINLAQATDKGYYNLSFGSSNVAGIVPSTSLDRYNAKLSATANISDKWTSAFNANFVTSNISKQSGANNGIVATVFPSPASYDLAGIPDHIKGDNYTQNTYRSTGGFDGPYWGVANNDHLEDNQRFYGNAYIKYHNDFDGSANSLDVKYQVGADAYTTNYTTSWGYGHANKKGEIDHTAYSFQEYNSLLTGTFHWAISDDLDMDVLVGNEIVGNRSRQTEAYGKNYNFSGWNHLSNASVLESYQLSNTFLSVGTFANIAVDYKDMLYLNITGRQDMVSSMPRDSRTFFYPSISLGFVFTQLEMFRNDVLTFGKLRTSYAEVGQAATYRASYYSQPGYGGGFYNGAPISYPIGGITAFTPNSTIYDPNLVPQNTRSYEIGADLDFFNGRIGLNYTFSRQNVEDQIFTVPLAGSTGYGGLITNGGSIHTNAHEVNLNLVPIKMKNFEWNLGFNFTKIDNYVDELAPGVNSIFLGGFVTPQVRAGIGDKFPVIYGNGYLRNDKGQIVVDANGMPQAGDEQVIGRVSPDFQVGINTSFDIYKLRIAAVIDWKQGGQMYGGTKGLMGLYGMSQESADRRKDGFVFGKGSVKQNADGSYSPNDIKIPADRVQSFYTTVNNIDEYSIYDNSFIKLREISLSYPVLEKSYMNINFNVFARNILLWTEIDGFDPESTQGNTNMAGAFERFSLPGASSYGLGFTLTF